MTAKALPGDRQGLFASGGRGAVVAAQSQQPAQRNTSRVNGGCAPPAGQRSQAPERLAW